MRINKHIISLLVTVVFLIAAFLLYPSSKQSYQTQITTRQSMVNELAAAQCHMQGLLPDPICTPGVVDQSVTQDNIGQTICISGYTKTIRPPASYTDNLKIKQMKEYGFTDAPREHEEDHLISLELGGSPDDPKNLWPEPGNSPNPKDKVEDFLHTAICDGKLSLRDAQTRIATNWTTAENGI